MLLVTDIPHGKCDLSVLGALRSVTSDSNVVCNRRWSFIVVYTMYAPDSTSDVVNMETGASDGHLHQSWDTWIMQMTLNYGLVDTRTCKEMWIISHQQHLRLG